MVLKTKNGRKSWHHPSAPTLLTTMTSVEAEANEAFITRAARELDDVGSAGAVRACIALLREGNEVITCFTPHFLERVLLALNLIHSLIKLRFFPISDEIIGSLHCSISRSRCARHAWTCCPFSPRSLAATRRTRCNTNEGSESRCSSRFGP